MNTFDGDRPRRDRAAGDESEVPSTVLVVERDAVVLFDVSHLGAWIRSTVVTDLARNR